MTIRVVLPPDLIDRVPESVRRTPGRQRLHRISTAAPAEQPVPLHRAMLALVRSNLVDKERDLLEVALDGGERITDRAAAVGYLGRTGSAPAIEALTEIVRRVPDEQVLARAAQALGGLGDERSLPDIEAAGRRAGGRAAAVLSFAATLITHRLGLPGHAQPAVPADQLLRPDDGPSQEFQVRPATSEEADQARADLAGTPLRTVLGGPGFHLTCGRNRLLILLADALTGRAAAAAFAGRNLLAGVIAARHPSLPTYSFARALLSSPIGGDRVRLGGYRLDGTQYLAGEGTVAAGRLSFRMQAVDRPGACAIEIAADYDGTLSLFHPAATS